jgi:ABC-2 type transport system permease protein
MEVIYMLWSRQMKHYFRSRGAMIGALGQPILFLLSFGGGMGPVFRRAGEGNYLHVLAPGVIGMTVLFAAVYTGAELMWDRKFGFLKETLVAPVPRTLIMLGRTMGGATMASIQGLMIVLACVIAGFRPAGFSATLNGLFFMALIAIMFTCLGTTIAGMLTEMPTFQVVINLLVMPIFFLSGALFPLTGVPKYLAFVTSLNPFAYGVDGMSSAFTGRPAHFGMTVDLIVMTASIMILMITGTYMFSRTQA